MTGKRWNRFTSLLFPGAAVLLLAFLFRLDNPGSASQTQPDIPPISLAGYQRLLVLAPHSDDETLGSAGVMLAAQRLGMDVRVVIETNGDGSLSATMNDFRRIYPRHADFVRLGTMRQKESLNALKLLGVPAEHVYFLSYPDRGSPSLWTTHWSATNPYVSRFSGDMRSPYPITYNQNSVYAGEDLLADLRSIIDGYRPDLVIFPSPNDVHPDHWGLSAFTRLALALEQNDHPDYQPTSLAYLVHRPDFPEPRGLHPAESLLPPGAVYNETKGDWGLFELSQADIATKQTAIMTYRSQLPLLRGLLESFVRQNELFQRVHPAPLLPLATGDLRDPATWRDANGQPLAPVQTDPVRDFIIRNIVPAADLVAIYAAQTPDHGLEVCAQTRGKTEMALIYTLEWKAVSPEGDFQHIASNHELQPGWKRLELAGNNACAKFDPAELGDASLLFVGGNVRELATGILDQVAWQAVTVPKS
jgi:LmbE family N-acetylglucosaminyl deacetylase